MPTILVKVDGQLKEITFDNVRDIYTNENLRKAFLEHSTKETNRENPDFLLAFKQIEKNKKVTIGAEPETVHYRSMIMDNLHALYKKFIEESNDNVTINLPGPIQDKIINTMRDYSQNKESFLTNPTKISEAFAAFGNAQNNIEGLIAGDSFSRFVKAGTEAYETNKQEAISKEIRLTENALHTLIGDPTSANGGLAAYVAEATKKNRSSLHASKKNSVIFTFIANQFKKVRNAEDVLQKATRLQEQLHSLKTNSGPNPLSLEDRLKKIEQINHELKTLIKKGIEADKKAHGIFSQAGRVRTIMNHALFALSGEHPAVTKTIKPIVSDHKHKKNKPR